jgi:hypothetical protein
MNVLSIGTILSQWVVYYLANKFTALLDSKTSLQKEFNIRDNEDNEVGISLYQPVDRAIKVKNKPSKTRFEVPLL